MKKHSRKVEQSESLRQPTRRDSREVMAELVAQLSKQLDVQDEPVPGVEPGMAAAESLNLDRLTAGVDLGDQWSNYCILGLSGEILAEGQFRARRQEIAEFFRGLAQSRVVVEVGTRRRRSLCK